MTTFEKSQSPKHFVAIGRMSYRMKVHIQDNPYKDNPYRGLWLKGYQAERRKNQFKKKV